MISCRSRLTLSIRSVVVVHDLAGRMFSAPTILIYPAAIVTTTTPVQVTLGSMPMTVIILWTP